MAKKKKKIKNLGTKILVWIMLITMILSMVASLAIYFPYATGSLNGSVNLHETSNAKFVRLLFKS